MGRAWRGIGRLIRSIALRGVLLASMVAIASLATGCAGGGGGAALVVALLVALGVGGCASRGDAPDARAGDARAGHCEPCCGFRPDFGYCGSSTTSCFCPAGVSCNYAWGCIDASVPFDGGVARDSGGTLEPCCVLDDGGLLGTVSSCFCPAGTACGFASFVDCGDGACSAPDAGGCATDAGL